jgi:hypothetical protein
VHSAVSMDLVDGQQALKTESVGVVLDFDAS